MITANFSCVRIFRNFTVYIFCGSLYKLLVYYSDVLKDRIRVRAGDHDNKVDDDNEEEFEVEHLISHAAYDGKKMYPLYSPNTCSSSVQLNCVVSIVTKMMAKIS